MTALSTSPAAGFPAGLRKRAAFDEQAIAAAPKHAAGTLFVAPDGDVLLCRRSTEEKNYGGHWALPGGGAEDGETPEQTADRESREELGATPAGARKVLDKRVTPTGMAFHTFVQPVDNKFSPRLNSEHVGYAWVPLDQLPQPVHPAVEQTLKERVLGGDEPTPEARAGFARWAREPERPAGADSIMVLALDRDSVRAFDIEGRLRIKSAHISKATVNPYRGSEIPNAEALGLEPDKIYRLLRDPDELAKAAASFNGIQVLRKHIPVSADDHQPWDVVGTTGTEAKFDDPYLDNSLVIWVRDAIDGIEDESQRELSCGYHYRAEMTAGNFRGIAFDGVMRDIRGNHVALVEQGRAGPDVIVGDAALQPTPQPDNQENTMSKPTRLAKLALTASAAMIRPILAQDAGKVDLLPIFKGLTRANFKSKQVGMALDAALKGKIASDATLEQVNELLGNLEAAAAKTEGADAEVDEKSEAAMQAAGSVEPMEKKPAAVDDGNNSEKLSAFLKGKGMGEDDIKRACDIMGGTEMGGALDADDDEEEKKRKAEEAAKKKEGAMDDKDKVSKPAMDAAIAAASEATAKRVRAEVVKAQTEVRQAERDVQPFIGELPATMAFDSAESIYRHTLKALGVEGSDTIHASALKTILLMQPKAGAKPSGGDPIAMDAAAVDDFNTRYPSAARIGRA